MKPSHRHTTGVNRREFIQAGFAGFLGLTLADVLQLRAASANTKSGKPVKSVKNCIMVFMTGAPSHQDIWDLKPNAAREYRGEFNPIKTNVPGIEITEHLPLVAQRAHHLALVRSMTHGNNVHEFGTHLMLTGINEIPTGAKHYATRKDWPALGSIVSFARPSQGVPTAVILPTYLHNGYGFSGQNSGFMDAKHDPWIITEDPNKPNFRVPNLTLAPGISGERLNNRQALLSDVEKQRRGLDSFLETKQLSDYQQQAFSLLTSPRTRDAFDMDKEPAKVRDQYGRHPFGQSLLLARKLVEAGVGLVQANMGAMNTWDTHTNNFNHLKDNLLPPFDRALSALLDDLHQRGLLKETLVVITGEFGRTPKVGTDNGGNITAANGRDHWGGVFTTVFAGGGVRGGQVIGKSDNIAAYPAKDPFYPADMGATILHTLGIDPHVEITDPEGRPLRANNGSVITSLF